MNQGKLPCAYTFLYEDSTLCDYEVATDEFASLLGVADHWVKQFDLGPLVELVYHANGSMRGKVAITDSDMDKLISMEQRLQEQLGPWKDFVLPQGSLGASHLHLLRSRAKSIVRILYRADQEPGREKLPIIHDFWNTLSNLLFLMALLENRAEGVDEKVFVSKSY